MNKTTIIIELDHADAATIDTCIAPIMRHRGLSRNEALAYALAVGAVVVLRDISGHLPPMLPPTPPRRSAIKRLGGLLRRWTGCLISIR